MADDDLEAIRKRRMAELQQQMGASGQNNKQQEEAQARQEDMKNSILAQVLDQSARARLNSIALVKPDKAKSIEVMIIRMAQSGQVQSKINEEQLISLLEQVSQTQKKTTVKFDRRRVMDSDDDD